MTSRIPSLRCWGIVMLLCAVVPFMPVRTALGRPAESPWEVQFTAGRGISLRHQGVPIIWQSTLYVVKPGWTGKYFEQPAARQIITRGGDAQPLVSVEAANEYFRSRYRLQALDDRRFLIRFEGELLQDVPAEIEYNAGYFNADLIAHRPFRAVTTDGEVEGVVPVYPKDGDQVGNDLAANWRRLEFDSRIGRLAVEVDAPYRVLFFDARRTPLGWVRGAPIFWCGVGVPQRELAVGRPFRMDLIVEIDPAPGRADADEPVQVTPAMREVKTAQSTRDRPLRVIPQPKSIQAGDGVYVLRPRVEWSILQPAGETRLADAVRSVLEGRFSLAPAEGTVRAHDEQWTVIRIGASDDSTSVKPAGPLPQWAFNPEGYQLRVNDRGIAIAAPTPQGAFYGLQTLAQLARPHEQGLVCPFVTIEDWPAMEFRGAHWFPSASGVPFHRKLIERVMARYKMNHAIIQCEAAKWQTHPEIAAPSSIARDDLRGLVELARANFIEPIPLLNVPGHAEWIFRNQQNRHFVEDPQTPYAYCVNHPDSFAFITDVLTEAIEIFQPSRVHLGHDEVTMRGRFPNPDCPQGCGRHTVTELVGGHVQRMHAWLAERNIEMMIWGDMFISREEVPDAAFAPNAVEARARRGGLPDDIIVTDWHYDPHPHFPSLEIFHGHGLTTIAGTWHDPLNIYHFAQAALRDGSSGLLQTTWAGFFPDESVLADAGMRQFTAFILAAEYAWSGRDDLPAALPYDPGTEFERAYYGHAETERAGVVVDLSAAALTSRSEWGIAPGWDMTALPAGEGRFGDVLFDIPQENVVTIGDGPAAPAGASGTVIIDIGRGAEQLLLLNASTTVPHGTTAARMIVRYADGGREVFDLVVGQTTAGWTETTSIIGIPAAWQVITPWESVAGLRITRWTNPHPDREIEQVQFESAGPGAAWVLAGLTLLE